MSECPDLQALLGEVLGADLGDPRLDRRLQTIVERIGAAPDASFPQAMSSAELEGTYRFLSNPRVTPEAILAPHIEATRERARREDRVLIVHDTTDFSYRVDGAREGLGRLRKSSQTYFAHFSLVVSGDGARRPLGVAALETWTRGPTPTGTEAARWWRQARVAATNMACGTRAIHVMDREADDYDLLTELTAADQRFVIRACVDRKIVLDDEVVGKMSDVLTTLEHVVEREAPLSRRRAERSPVKARIHPARAPRTAKLCASATTLRLRRPPKQGKSGKIHGTQPPPSLDVNVVRVWEPAPPEQCAPVEWILLTNEPIATASDVLAILDVYRARWTIEEYFKALKTGCAYEQRQLHDYEALVNALAVFAPVAYHVLLLRSRARVAPEAPADTVLSKHELDVLRALGRRPLPIQPTTRDAMLAVAALGGHIKYSGDPGWLTLSRGYQQLATLTAGWVAAKMQRGMIDD